LAVAWRNSNVICMDEPTMGLAPAFVERMLDLIQEINRSGVSVLLVEQNASLALSIGHRRYVLHNGLLSTEGSARELLDSPAVREAYLGQRRAAAPAVAHPRLSRGINEPGIAIAMEKFWSLSRSEGHESIPTRADSSGSSMSSTLFARRDQTFVTT
jgi:ABC-type multidrug transport system ATPase subunit